MSEPHDKPDILEPFRIARRLETEGRAFFEEAARKAESDLVRQTFQFLAAEEIRHIEKIDKFVRSLEISEGREVPEIEDSNAEAKLAEFNNRLAALRDTISERLRRRGLPVCDQIRKRSRGVLPRENERGGGPPDQALLQVADRRGDDARPAAAVLPEFRLRSSRVVSPAPVAAQPAAGRFLPVSRGFTPPRARPIFSLR